MSQDQIAVAAQRVALLEQSEQAAQTEAQQARDRIAGLMQRRADIAAEISAIRGSRPASDITDTEAARIHVLGLDQLDIEPLIESATNAANDAATKVNAESMALGVARRDLAMATRSVEIKAVEAKVREAEKVMMAGIAELGALKREAGANWRTAGDVYRLGFHADRFVRLGVVPPQEAV